MRAWRGSCQPYAARAHAHGVKVNVDEQGRDPSGHEMMRENDLFMSDHDQLLTDDELVN